VTGVNYEWQMPKAESVKVESVKVEGVKVESVNAESVNATCAAGRGFSPGRLTR
jgi:hypothetical protein